MLSGNGSSASYSTTKTFSITVNPCTGISSLTNSSNFYIFPNPFKDLLSVAARTASDLIIIDLSGALVLKTKLNEGKNEIITSELKAGMYLIQAKNAENSWRGRFVKE